MVKPWSLEWYVGQTVRVQRLGGGASLEGVKWRILAMRTRQNRATVQSVATGAISTCPLDVFLRYAQRGEIVVKETVMTTSDAPESHHTAVLIPLNPTPRLFSLSPESSRADESNARALNRRTRI